MPTPCILVKRIYLANALPRLPGQLQSTVFVRGDSEARASVHAPVAVGVLLGPPQLHRISKKGEVLVDRASVEIILALSTKLEVATRC